MAKSSRWWRRFLAEHKYGVAIGTGAAIGAGGTLGCIYSLKCKLQETVPAESSLLDGKDVPYIYAVDPEESSAFLKQHFPRWWPVSFIARPIAYQLFEDIRKSITQINDDSLRTFAKFSSLFESECNHFSICMDLKTAVALARCGADPRLFISPRVITKDHKDYYGNKFRHLFSTLPNENIHATLESLISRGLKQYHPTEKEQEDKSLDYYTGFESDFHLSQNPVKEMSEHEFLKICLLGVVSHSRIRESISELLSQDILDLLVVISREYRDSVDIMSLVLKVLANISCDTSSAQLIKDTGCLKILAIYGTSHDVRLALPAKRALHNLDRRGTNSVLPPGIYQLHPEFGCDDCSSQYDIVFIHGLLGGIFRTWRRHDINPNKDFSKTDKDEHETRMSIWKARILELRSKSPVQHNNNCLDETVVYPTRRTTEDGQVKIDCEQLPLELDQEIVSTPTQCWPRDWLPTNCPKSRIIGVDFESFVSRWMTICPIETAERLLKDRSAELLNKLQDIGIGQRPVVFVTHSMGGLLLKSLLCQAADSDDPERQKIASSTKGVVFCSVPHRGTDMAVLNTARRWLLLPTEEIDELSDEDKQLTNLNEAFIELTNQHNYKILSFGEVLETRTGLGMQFKLVPFYSSDIGIGDYYPLRLDHLGTCKPWSRGSFLYVKTVNFIKSVCPTWTHPPANQPSVNLNPVSNSTTTTKTNSGYLSYANSIISVLEPVSHLYDWITNIFYNTDDDNSSSGPLHKNNNNNNNHDNNGNLNNGTPSSSSPSQSTTTATTAGADQVKLKEQ
ncbi:protein SERAC1 isoform X2 [Folsomia candida]|uniref:Protein SERAC1 n=1 Tax=Folsomia candida TaxID=158441 RepID=A0A226EYP9_FOLCA|nr:protein SERAC1 isoform X2 [Folsomia candida]OXA62204.1 Protein SERAC1 [Folsomia candida]